MPVGQNGRFQQPGTFRNNQQRQGANFQRPLSGSRADVFRNPTLTAGSPDMHKRQEKWFPSQTSNTWSPAQTRAMGTRRISPLAASQQSSLNSRFRSMPQSSRSLPLYGNGSQQVHSLGFYTIILFTSIVGLLVRV